MRKSENVLSPAQVKGCVKSENHWNVIVHDLATSRARSNVTGKRQSREEGRMQKQAAIAKRVSEMSETGKADLLQPTKEFQGLGGEVGQIVVYKLPLNDVAWTLQVGLVLTVFRDAMSSQKTRSGRPVMGSWLLVKNRVTMRHMCADQFLALNIDMAVAVVVVVIAVVVIRCHCRRRCRSHRRRHHGCRRCCCR